MRATWIDNSRPITNCELEAEGVFYARLALGESQEALDRLRAARGYVHQDEVRLGADTPNLDALCAKFRPEHAHDDDEVRFVLEGEGIFDIRGREDRLMRVVVEAGDLIVVPAGRNHSFVLTEARNIRAVRLFKDPSGWVPRYREAAAA